MYVCTYCALHVQVSWCAHNIYPTISHGNCDYLSGCLYVHAHLEDGMESRCSALQLLNQSIPWQLFKLLHRMRSIKWHLLLATHLGEPCWTSLQRYSRIYSQILWSESDWRAIEARLFFQYCGQGSSMTWASTSPSQLFFLSSLQPDHVYVCMICTHFTKLASSPRIDL